MGAEGVRLAHPWIHFWSRGPGKAYSDALTRLVDRLAPPPKASEALVQAIQHGLTTDRARLSRLPRGADAVIADLKPAFTDLSRGWTVLEANAERGFSSASFWARDPAGRRVLIKYHHLPEGAANERTAYTLGRALKLPINEVQLGIWEGKLVSLHHDVARPGETAMTLMDLPAREQAALLADVRLAEMDLFDHLVQNVDRNPRNIMVTRPKLSYPGSGRLRVHLIDHSNIFSVGLLDIVSLYAAKFQVRPLVVVHFSPEYEARAFREYLSGISPERWTQARTLLNRIGNLTDAQIEGLVGESKEILPAGHLARTRRVLQLKRDVARELARFDHPPVPPLQPRPYPGAPLNAVARNAVQYLRGEER